MSNAMVRVKIETTIDKNDAFVDIILDEDEENQSRSANREKLVVKVLSDCQDILSELMEDEGEE